MAKVGKTKSFSACIRQKAKEHQNLFKFFDCSIKSFAMTTIHFAPIEVKSYPHPARARVKLLPFRTREALGVLHNLLL
jgi:hypothetical protein